MAKKHKNIIITLTAAMLMAVVGTAGVFSSGTASAESGTWKVIAVAAESADTIYVTQGRQMLKVRMIGIDAPEASSRANTKKGCYGSQAKTVVKKLALGKNVRLVADPNVPDKYTDGALMRYVYTPEGWDVGASMINSGAAKEYTYSRKTYTYRSWYRKLKTDAYNANRGIWNKKICSMNR
ncbi:thermonuclease family protein [Candidatus Saccharibacteria bacterium]|nr:thermonuclease family protein [Candidatus Saccharibacteria bacterium]